MLCYVDWENKIEKNCLPMMKKKWERRMEWDSVAKIKKNKQSEEITDVEKNSRI